MIAVCCFDNMLFTPVVFVIVVGGLEVAAQGSIVCGLRVVSAELFGAAFVSVVLIVLLCFLILLGIVTFLTIALTYIHVRDLTKCAGVRAFILYLCRLINSPILHPSCVCISNL